MRVRLPLPVLALLLGATSVAALARPAALPRRPVRLDLPAPPVALLAVDIDGDGDRDLAVVLDYSRWTTQGVSETRGFEQFVEVVPLLEDRREVHVFLASGGALTLGAPPLLLSRDVLSIAAGPPAAPLLALTDDGVSAIRLERGAGAAQLVLVPLLRDPPVVAGSGALLTDLPFVRDIDGDGTLDLSLPARDGIAFYRGSSAGFADAPSQRVALPADRSEAGDLARRFYPLPRVEDVTGDGTPDLVIAPRAQGGDPLSDSIRVGIAETVVFLPGLGGGRFGAPVRVPLRCVQRPSPPTAGNTQSAGSRDDLLYFGDIDGDGRAEVVTAEDLPGSESIKHAGEPRSRLRLYHMAADGSLDPQPYAGGEIMGVPITVSSAGVTLRAFTDLDGDRRKEIISVSFQLSVMRALGAVMTKRMSVPLTFHVYRQDERGRFIAVPNQELSDTLKLDFNHLRLDRLAQFAGDFDGDGRIDFVHLSVGRSITIHPGHPGCRYDDKPALALELDEPLKELTDVRVMDLDADGRADLAIVHERGGEDPVAASPVWLDLYLSGAVPASEASAP